MRLTLRRSMITLVAGMTMACASSGAKTSGSSPSANRATITDAELAASGTETAYDVIQRLRPEYLRPKPSQKGNFQGVTTAPPPAVIVNGQNSGELADLRRIPAISLSAIHYYTIEEAKRKFGMQYQGGAIELTYRTR